MPGKTTIGWTHKTWNPTTGCVKLSRGCDNCYAEEFAERWRGIPGHAYEQGFDLKLWPNRLDAPKAWPAGTRVFVNSMSDLFYSKVPDDFVDQVFETMRACPDLIFQILTKRPKRMAKYLNERGYEPGMIPHVWCGTSIEDVDAIARADELRKSPVDVRFISAEPLLGPLTGINLEGVHWLIAGGESGQKARPMEETWVRELKQACDDSGTAFFMKQFGTLWARQHGLKGKAEDPDEFPADLRVRRYPAGLPPEELLEGPAMHPQLF